MENKKMTEKTGCIHNAERYIEYGPQTAPKWRHGKKSNASYEIGDCITFKCPYGCEDINICIVASEHGGA